MKAAANLSNATEEEARSPFLLASTYAEEKVLALSSVGNTSTVPFSAISIRSLRCVMMGL